MGKRQTLNHIYKYPLPVVITPLPQVIPHNPLSILYFLWQYLFPTKPKPVVCHGELSNDYSVVVKENTDMNTLWSMGFFGKGTFSRSEPTWFVRTARRLGLSGGETVTAEDITNARRQERKKFKQERAKVEQEELEKRRALEHDNQPTYVTTGEGAASRGSSEVEKVETSNNRDAALVSSDNTLIQLETLQLMPCEAVFLAKLGSLNVNGIGGAESLFNQFYQKFGRRFIEEYIVYHHLRSRGWCVRSGVKFGTDFLLYRRGPPFSHAEFTIMVMSNNENGSQKDWWWNTSVGRVVGGVKKTLVFSYVSLPSDEKLASSIDEILTHSRVREVVYKRWVPTRNRD